MAEKQKKLSGIGTGLVLSLSFSFLVCVYAPLELFLTNQSEFWMQLGVLWLPVAILFLGCFTVGTLGFVIARLINKKLYDICLVIASVLLFGFYIQGNFFVSNLPSFEGAPVYWNQYPIERVKSIIAFIVPLAVLVFVLIKFKSDKFRKVVLIASGALFLLLGITLTTLLVTTDTSKTENLVSTYKNEFQMSTDQNLVVLVLDTVDNDYFLPALKQDKELQEALDGFTCFEDVLSGYPYTSRSMPLMLSGEWYENKGSFDEYQTAAISKSPLMTTLEKDSYNIGIYERYGLGLTTEEFSGRLDNCFRPKANYTSTDIYRFVLRMGGIKFAPWDFKKRCWDVIDYSYANCTSESGDALFKWSDRKFYNTLKDSNPITLTDKKCARIIHLEGCHIPFRYDEEFNPIENGSYELDILALNNLVEQYFTRLKESGVYDNTAIVILADHGYAGNDERDDENVKKRFNPMLLVKGIGESHPLAFSSAPVSYGDLSDGYLNLLSGKPSAEVFGCKDGEKRTRRAMLYAYNDEDHMRELIVEGSANEPEKFAFSGKKFDAE